VKASARINAKIERRAFMASTPLKSTGTGVASHVIRELASLYGLAGSVIWKN